MTPVMCRVRAVCLQGHPRLRMGVKSTQGHVHG